MKTIQIFQASELYEREFLEGIKKYLSNNKQIITYNYNALKDIKKASKIIVEVQHDFEDNFTRFKISYVYCQGILTNSIYLSLDEARKLYSVLNAKGIKSLYKEIELKKQLAM